MQKTVSGTSFVGEHTLGGPVELEALYRLTDRLYRADSLDDVYDAALDTITSTLRCTRASILLFSDAGLMQFVAWRGLSEQYRKTLEGHSPWKPGEKNPLPIFVSDIDQTDEAEWIKAAIRREGIRGLGFIPLMAGGEVVGKFMTYYELPHVFTASEIDLATHIARQVGFSLERRRADKARRKFEDELRESEERFRLMSEHAPVMIWLSNPDGSCQHLNHMLCEFWNVAEQNLKTFGWQDTMHPEDAPEIGRLMMEALRERRSVAIKGRYRDARGRWRVLETDARPRFSPAGEFLGMIGVNIDVTEREEAVRALRESEERLRLATEGAGIFAWEADLQSRSMWWSENAPRLIGCEDSGMPVHMEDSLFFVLAEDRSRLEREFQSLFARRAGSFMMEFRGPPSPQVQRHWQAQGKIIYDGTDNPVRVVGITQDVTARRQSQEALASALASLEIALDGADAAPWEYNAATREVEWSPRGYVQLGLANGETMPSLDTFLSFVHPEDRSALEAVRAQEKMAAPGSKFTLQLRLQGHDRITRWIERRSIVGGDEPDGRRILGVDIDITERKRVERRLELEYSVNRIVSTATDLDQTRFLILQELCTHMEAACAEWWEPSPDGRTLHCAAFVAREDGIQDFARMSELTFLAKAEGLPGRVCAMAAPLWIDDVRVDPEFPRSRAATAAGLRSAIGFPLLKGDECIGAVAFFSRSQLAHDADKLRLFSALGYKLGSFLQRIRAEDDVRQSEERLASALRAGKLGVFDLDVQSGRIEWDQTLRSLWGAGPDEVITPDVFEAGIHPDDRPGVEAAIASAFDPEGARRYEAEYRVVNRADQSHRWVRAEGDVIFRAEVPVRFVGTVQDITDRKRAEEHIRLLMQEVNHRSKNMLAVVQAIAQQTSAQKEPRIFVQRFAERLQALAASHDLLVHNTWAGVELSDLVRAQLSHFRDLIGRRIRIEGQPLRISASAAQSLGMALHELTTNAGKYGSLSTEQGEVIISWERDDLAGSPGFRMSWHEFGGPAVLPPESKGFGTRVIKDAVERAVEGKVRLEYLPEGFVWSLVAPQEKILEISRR